MYIIILGNHRMFPLIYHKTVTENWYFFIALLNPNSYNSIFHR